ncbi:MAG: hypothetical protein HKN17_07725 [Rhodothermales bacterium]|nr:hypothetical protein [Rhodothermales bacterium]
MDVTGIEIIPLFEWAGLGPLSSVLLGGVVGGAAGWGASRLSTAFVIPPTAHVIDRRISCAQTGFVAGAFMGWICGGIPGALVGGLAGIVLGS